MGSPSNKAANAANASEKERLAGITRTQGAVNDVFNSDQRKGDIADFVDAVRTFKGDDLERQRVKTDRESRFALARGGLTGGSVNVDRNAELGREFVRGQLDIDRQARGAGAGLEAADQDARARLIQLATSGLDATTGAAQSAAALRSSLEAGRSTELVQGAGNAFGNFAKFNQSSLDAKERRRAISETSGLFAPSSVGAFNFGGRG